jgi:hypothetical protein
VIVCGEAFPFVNTTASPALIVTGSPKLKNPSQSFTIAMVALGDASGVTAQRTGPVWLGLGMTVTGTELATAAMLMLAPALSPGEGFAAAPHAARINTRDAPTAPAVQG